MRKTDLVTVAKIWFNDRCNIVTKRFNKQIDVLNASIMRYNLIEEFVEHGMNDWKSEDINKYFVDKYHEDGEDYANMVLSQPQRSFLPENIAKNDKVRTKQKNELKEIKKKLKNIGDTIIEEAFDIIEKQEKFFAEIDEINSSTVGEN